MSNAKKEIPTVSLGFLRAHLNAYPDDFEVSFGGLEFSRVKQRGDNLIHVEFLQPVYLDDEGRVVVDNLD
jgi:hypothetical protein